MISPQHRHSGSNATMYSRGAGESKAAPARRRQVWSDAMDAQLCSSVKELVYDFEEVSTALRRHYPNFTFTPADCRVRFAQLDNMQAPPAPVAPPARLSSEVVSTRVPAFDDRVVCPVDLTRIGAAALAEQDLRVEVRAFSQEALVRVAAGGSADGGGPPSADAGFVMPGVAKLVVAYAAPQPSRSRRNLQKYDNPTKETLRLLREGVLNSIELMCHRLHIKGAILLHDNQQSCAGILTSLFINLQILVVLAIGLTQSGKTGAMLATITEWLKSKNATHCISTENIYIITGLSSKEWKEQTKSRLPREIRDRIFHRNDLLKSKFQNDIKGKKNVLIIMDEIQVAGKKNQTVYKAFKKIGLLNKSYLLKNDIKLIEFSATPDGVLYDLKGWGNHHKIIKLQPGVGYVSAKDLFSQNRVKQFKDLYGYNKETGMVSAKTRTNIAEIKSAIEQFDSDNRGPLFHIIRTVTGGGQDTTINTFKSIFGEENYIYTTFDCTNKNKEDINDILKNKPEKHTFIFIKEMQRCAKTLVKMNIGILYDRWIKSKINDSVIIQGLAGRNTGYDDNGFSIVYTNIPTIKNYFKLWKYTFQTPDGVTIPWNSNTTVKCKQTGKIITSKRGTFNDPKNIIGMAENNIEQPPQSKMRMNHFNSEEDARAHHATLSFRQKLGKRSTKLMKIKEDEEGFPIFRGERRLIDEMDADPNLEKSYGHSHNLNKNHGSCWLIPCYGNKTDKDTIQWRLYYLPKKV